MNTQAEDWPTQQLNNVVPNLGGKKTCDIRTMMSEVYTGMKSPACIRLNRKAEFDLLASIIDALVEYGRILLTSDTDVEPPERLSLVYSKFLLLGLKVRRRSLLNDQSRFEILYYFVCKCAIMVLNNSDRNAEKQQKRLENAFMRQFCTDIFNRGRGKTKPQAKIETSRAPAKVDDDAVARKGPYKLVVYKGPNIDQLIASVVETTPRRTAAERRAVIRVINARSPCVRKLLPSAGDMLHELHVTATAAVTPCRVQRADDDVRPEIGPTSGSPSRGTARKPSTSFL
eukprot:GEMP01080467.1.p1 GENE.GEMP01080467.1~~GEMP01080467.1.p1  ORF type:complete len:286 (+),score=52.73 GEMP01080467.1:38-895(+)